MPPINVSIDPVAIARAMVDALIQAILDLIKPIPETFLAWVADQLSGIWNGIWDSGANLLATPFALTIDFGPAKLLGGHLFLGIYAIAGLSVVLLAASNAWSTAVGHGGAAREAINGVLLGALMGSLSTFIVAQAYMLCGLASDALGRMDYRPAFQPQTLLSFGPSLFLGAFTLLVMMIRGWKLLTRAAYRIVCLMFLTPFAPVAGAVWAIRQLRFVTVWYWHQIGGWLAGGALAIGAISLGVQLATVGNTNAVLSLVFGVALIDVAHDLLGIFTGGNGGGGVPSPFSAFLGAAVGGAVGGAVAEEVVVGAGAGAADLSIGALPAAGEAAGLGY